MAIIDSITEANAWRINPRSSPPYHIDNCPTGLWPDFTWHIADVNGFNVMSSVDGCVFTTKEIAEQVLARFEERVNG